MKIRIFKIKKDKLDQWKDWCFKLNTSLRDDAIKTLEEENLDMEGFFLFELNGEHYAGGFTDTDREEHEPKDSELNREHKKMITECLEKIEGGKAEILYFLRNKN